MTDPRSRADDHAALGALVASASCRAVDDVVARLGAGWRTSIARRLLAGVSAPGPAALAALVTSLVALGLPFAAARTEPLTWVVPAGALVVSAVVLAFAPAGSDSGISAP